MHTLGDEAKLQSLHLKLHLVQSAELLSLYPLPESHSHVGIILLTEGQVLQLVGKWSQI